MKKKQNQLPWDSHKGMWGFIWEQESCGIIQENTDSENSLMNISPILGNLYI